MLFPMEHLTAQLLLWAQILLLLQEGVGEEGLLLLLLLFLAVAPLGLLLLGELQRMELLLSWVPLRLLLWAPLR